MFEFELAKTAFHIDKRSPFTQMVNRFDSLDQLVTGCKLSTLQKLIEEKLKEEHARVNAVRADPSNYTNSKKWTKIPAEIIQLETIYREALHEVKADCDLKGLTVVEYCSMCIYYDS